MVTKRVLQICLFGAFQLYRDPGHREIRVIPTLQSLLTLLIMQCGRMCARGRVASLLWGDRSEEQAHSCLNTAVWRLRKVLEPPGVLAGTYLISTPNGDLGFRHTSDCWVDVIEFEEIVRRVTSTECAAASADDIRLLEKSVQLYRGDLLETCDSEWILIERERLRLMYIEAAYYLMGFYQYCKDYVRAIRQGQQILLADPLREDVHRCLMRLYDENGQRALAARQYQYCRKILASELGIEPMPETRLTYHQLLGKSLAEASEGVGCNPASDTMASLHSAVEYLSRAQRDLQDALANLNE